MSYPVRNDEITSVNLNPGVDIARSECVSAAKTESQFKSQKQTHSRAQTLSYPSSLDRPHLRELATQAAFDHAMAVKIADPVLEAVALLRIARLNSSSNQPRKHLVGLSRAEKIFRLNGQSQQVAVCLAVRARALYAIGEDRRAIVFAKQALTDALLPIEDRIASIAVVALSHGYLGELDLAVQIVRNQALPMAQSTGNGPLLGFVYAIQAVTSLQLTIHWRHPRLWFGLPAFDGTLAAVTESAPDPASILELCDKAQAALPVGHRRDRIGIVRQLTLGLSGNPSEASAASAHLAHRASLNLEADPSLAAWELYAQALLLTHSLNPNGALRALKKALSIADDLGLDSLSRNVLQLQTSLYEGDGDVVPFIATYKRLAKLQLRSVAQNLGVGDASVTARHERNSATCHDDGRSLYKLVPSHVKRAVRFIETGPLNAMSVADVVRHCQVSRRNLEVSFKENKACTVATYIRRLRLDEAAVALQTTRESIPEVARAVGYKSQAAFAREFRSRFGLNPSAWRQLTPQELESDGEGAGRDIRRTERSRRPLSTGNR